MRLLNVDTIQLEEFIVPPPYVTLSHTWGSEEISLQEFGNIAFSKTGSKKKGWTKIEELCKMLRESHATIKYAWVDTCCIDKTSSAELSEAINSMFRWYSDSAFCCVFLSDVERQGCHLGPEFDQSRWFKRGFTLQELLAPADVQFFDSAWRLIGNKKLLASRIAGITKIPEDILTNGGFQFASVAQKISWAADRQTTRIEDIAYCLLGIFDVNMPLLYGEGDKAFIRLQEEILKRTDDQSIFAWDASNIDPQVGKIGVLAPSPTCFSGSSGVQALPGPLGGNEVISNRGVSIDLPLRNVSQQPLPDLHGILHRNTSVLAILSCLVNGDFGARVGIRLKPDPSQAGTFSRDATPFETMQIYNPKLDTTRIILQKQSTKNSGLSRGLRCLVRYNDGSRLPWILKECFPEASWAHNRAARSLTIGLPSERVLGHRPEYVYAAAAFQYLTRSSKKRLFFAIELRFGPALGRFTGRLVNLTPAFANSQTPSLRQAIDENLDSAESDQWGRKDNPSLQSFTWKDPSILSDSVSLEKPGAKLALSVSSAPVQATVLIDHVHGAHVYTIQLSQGHRSLSNIF